MERYRFAQIAIHSVPKGAAMPAQGSRHGTRSTLPAPSEDAVATSTTAIGVADGATAKPADGLAPSPIGTGHLAQFVADSAVASTLNGQELIDELNAAVADLP